MLGSFSAEAHLDPMIFFDITYSHSNTYDDFIQKIDTSGNLIWHQIIGAEGVDECIGVEVDDNNNIYVSG